MKKYLFVAFMLLIASFTYSQSNSVNLASIAFEKGHFDNAWENANSALQSPESLDKSLLYKAYAIRGKAGARLAYTALTKGEEGDLDKYADMAMQAYLDFKEILNTRDDELIKDITPEFYKLGHALLLSGTDYDAKNADLEQADSSLFDKSIDCYSATIELWQLAGREKYKPYYYRGDVLLSKKQFDKAMIDLNKAMDIYIATAHKNPDLKVGDLGYRIAYTEAGVFNNKESAMKTIKKTRELLEQEMQLAESKKEALSEINEDIKSEYDYLIGELNNLENSVTK